MGGSSSKKPPTLHDEVTPSAQADHKDEAASIDHAHIQRELAKDIAELVRKAGLENESTAKVVPCEWSGILHDNTRGSFRDFSSASCKREWFDHNNAQARAVEGRILNHWQELDADFIKGFASSAGLALPNRAALVQAVLVKRQKQENMYDTAFDGVVDDARRFLVNDMPYLWPSGTDQEVKDFCIQPPSCVTMRENYLCGLKTAQHLFEFTTRLASVAGCSADASISFGVKKPNRFRLKAAAKFPAKVAMNDFRHISDVYRMSIVAENGQQLSRMVEILQGFGRDVGDRRKQFEKVHWKDCQEYVVVERIKNRFAKPAQGGYRDLLVNLRINGYVSELQVHLKSIYELQKDHGAQLAKWFKYYDDREARPDLEEACGFTNYSSGSYLNEGEKCERNGKGNVSYSNGDRFDGQWSDGLKHGFGTYFYSSGDRYTGQFVNDRMNGHGKFTSHDHETYEGEFRDGRRHGEGKLTLKDGSEAKGRWWRNKRVDLVSI